ncbi:hypothetical protein DVH24_042250 [Malus domestica]|uniref:Uncharacterized protein n=1 Tax=Malus domestica TaxID=3750 RepID=A0A498IXL5_MALDO|nr:hypothetical protein DVH24_042250 [Malus domestica]
MNARDIQFFLEHLRVSYAYEISKFRVVHIKPSSKSHQARMQVSHTKQLSLDSISLGVGCPSYHKAVKKTSGSFECNEHGSLNRLPEPW